EALRPKSRKKAFRDLPFQRSPEHFHYNRNRSISSFFRISERKTVSDFWFGDALCCDLRGFLEEERLADQCFHHIRIERLGDEESRLGAFAGQQTFRESGDEDDGDGIVL